MTGASSNVRPSGGLRCRLVLDSDLDAVVALLSRGFPERRESYWRRGFARHTDRPLPEGYPTYGYLLEDDQRVVGVLLTLYSTWNLGGSVCVRCNLSSWYVEPDYRSQGALLEKVATRRPEVTYFDVTPAPATWPVVEARGFRRYGLGQIIAAPMLQRTQADCVVRVAGSDDLLEGLSASDRHLVRDHIAYGCLVLLCTDKAGTRPVILQARTIGFLRNVRRFGRLRCMQVIYAHALEDVVRFAGPIGRLVLRRARTPWIVMDADGPLRGLAGRYFAGRSPKYARGPANIPLGDLAYTEVVLFGP